MPMEESMSTSSESKPSTPRKIEDALNILTPALVLPENVNALSEMERHRAADLIKNNENKLISIDLLPKVDKAFALGKNSFFDI